MAGFKSTLKYGLPFVSFMILGSFLLREFASIRYEVHSFKRRYGTKRRDEEDDEDEMPVAAPIISDEEQIRALEKLGENSEWKNIRGPRPWEDNTEYSRDYRELMASLREKPANRK